MRRRVSSVAILGKPGRPDVEKLGLTMCAWLRERSLSAFFVPCVPAAEHVRDRVGAADLLVVLGGDGTFVSVARHFAPDPRPILGVNFGRVGFLAEVRPENWESAFARIVEEGVLVEEWMGLRYTLMRDGAELASGLAVNDLVVARGVLARLAYVDLSVGDTPLSSLRADGLIISTPMGSTGYTGSARGPILHPGLNVYAVTAICPFLSNFLPLVLPGDTPLSVTVHEADPELFMTVDGQELVPLRAGDSLRAVGLPGRIRLARLEKNGGYFEKLRAAGFTGGAPVKG